MPVEELLLQLVDKAGVAGVACWALWLQARRHDAVESGLRELVSRIDTLVTRLTAPRLGGM
jgi:hypothetical protein